MSKLSLRPFWLDWLPLYLGHYEKRDKPKEDLSPRPAVSFVQLDTNALAFSEDSEHFNSLDESVIADNKIADNSTFTNFNRKLAFK